MDCELRSEKLPRVSPFRAVLREDSATKKGAEGRGAASQIIVYTKEESLVNERNSDSENDWIRGVVPAKLVESIASIFSGSVVANPRDPRTLCSNVVPDSSINSRNSWSVWCRSTDLRVLIITSRARGHRAFQTFGGWHPCLRENSFSAWMDGTC